MKFPALALFFLIGCGDAGINTSFAQQALLGCITPETYGAIADDGLDDRVAIQTAIDAAIAGVGCVDFGPGTYHVTHRLTVGISNIPSLKIPGAVRLMGVGPDTIIAMLGTSVLPANGNTSDWTLINISALGASIADLTLDGSERLDTNEQTHLLMLAAGAYGTGIERVHFNLPQIPGMQGGDCVRFLGSATNLVRKTIIRDSVGVECDRSFLSLQRGVEDLLVERVESRVVGDQAVDFEPTGGGSFNCTPIIQRILIRDSEFRRGPNAQGSWTVAIGGDGCAVVHDVRIMDTVMEDGSADIIDASHVTLERINFSNRPSQGAPTIEIRKRATNIRIIDSTVTRLAGTSGSTIQISSQSGGYPTDVLLLGVTVNHLSDGLPILCENLPSLIVLSSTLNYAGVARTEFIKLRGIELAVGAPVIVDSPVTGLVDLIAAMYGLTDGGSPIIVRSPLN
jgi:hypothetical protein